LCLSGNSVTNLILCISNEEYNRVESINSLNFGQRAIKVKNTPCVMKHLSMEQMTIQLSLYKDRL
jgi:hypothetical protein